MRTLHHAAVLCVAIALLAGPSPRADILPGLETFGSLTLVDEIDCAADTAHRFRDYPAGASYVTNILGRATRVLHHRDDKGAYVSWRVGEGKGVVPNEPYVLVVDYPDEAPRSVTLMNFGNGTRHGWHTGFTVGDSMSPPYVTQSLESWPVPFSGEWKQVVEAMVPYKRATQYNGGSRINVATDGFDINFALILQKEAKDSVGLAVQSIRLYRIDSYDLARPTIPYPAEGLPRRLVTSREEMGDDDNHDAYSDDPTQFYKGRAKMIRLLGMNGCSKDLLEFGYMQNWNTYGRDWKWGYAPDYWTKAVEYLGEEDIDILPIYEYHGSRGSSGIGYNQSLMPWTLQSSTYPDRKFYFSHQLHYISNCMADLTSDEVLWDLEELFELTVLNLADKAHFRGMWLRNRGGMPMGFNDNAIARFNRETGRTNAGTEVTRADIYNDGNYRGTALYAEYRAWWYEKRRNLLSALHSYMTSKLDDDAVLYFSNTSEEPGEFWANWANPHPAVLSDDEDCTFLGKNFNQFTGLNWTTDLAATAADYWPNALHADAPTWGEYEINHDGPADDPHNYTNLAGVALCYPFNTVWTVADKTIAARYRTAADDLPFVRHYSLNENDLVDGANPPNGNKICGYYTCDWDHAGRAVMLGELYAMAYSDPTMLGYLFGSNLCRTDSVYVREFNLNYLSLPALKGEVLVGGAWPDTFTVRRWATPQGTYWAAINCDTRPWSGTVDFQTSAPKIWRTVGNARVALSNGTAELSLEPFQMVAFTDVSPEHLEIAVMCRDVSSGVATADVSVPSLPDTGTATLEWSTSPDFSDPVGTDVRTLSEPGIYSVLLTGLVPQTTHHVRATIAVGDMSVSSTAQFVSGPSPLALAGTTAEVAADGRSATLAANILRADVPDAVLTLSVRERTVHTWSDVAAGSTYSWQVPAALGRVDTYEFVLASAEHGLTTSAAGSFRGRQLVDWFTVAFAEQGYPQGGAWTNVPASYGSWDTPPTGFSTLGASSDNAGLSLAYRMPHGTTTTAVSYTPATASPPGASLHIDGRLLFSTGPLPAVPQDAFAGIASTEGENGLDFHVWSNGAWHDLASPAAIAPDTFHDWALDVELSGAPTVTLFIDGMALSPAVPLPPGTDTLRCIAYAGSGELGDFRGRLSVVTPDGREYYEVTLRSGANALAFRNAGTATEQFSVGIADATAGLWYTAFAANALQDEFHAVASTQADADGTLDLAIDTDRADALFVRLVSSNTEIPLGTAFSSLGED